MPPSPRRVQPDETYRDARQIGQVGRFFDDQRSAGVVAFSPLRWSSLLGRPGAMAWLLCSRAATKSGKPTVAENVLAALLASPFEREPARYRIYETGAPPMALPTLPSGYVQATAPLGDDGAVFVVRDSVVARAACTSVIERAGAGGFARLAKTAFSRTLPAGRSLSLAQQVVAISKKRGALPVPVSAANQLARATGMSRAAATALFAGEGYVPYERPFSPLDFDYAAELLDACLGDDPEAPFAPLGKGPRDTNSGVARMIARHEALIQGRDAPFLVAQGAGRARPGTPCVSLRTTRDRAKTQRVKLLLSARAEEVICRLATKRADDFIEAEAGVKGASSAAIALQTLRVQEGIDAFRRVMRELARAAGDEAEAAIDFVYAHTEIG